MSGSVVDDAEFLREVLSAVPLFVARLDEHSRISFINRLQPGFELEQVIGRPVTEFVPGEAREIHVTTIERVRRTGVPERFRTAGAGADGRTAHYETHVVPIGRAERKLEICLIAVEVTDHVRHADELQESEQKLRIAVEAAGVALWRWDPEEQQVEWNERAHAITGSDQPVGPRAYLEHFVHPADRERLADCLDREHNFEQRLHRITRTDGETRWILPTGSAVVSGPDNALRRMAGFLDVTEQRQIEESLRQAQKISAIGELTAGVAHNFNNMLAVILPALDLVRAEGTTGQRDLLDEAIQAARRASELIAQLMTFAGQRRALNRERTELVSIVETAVAMCERTFDRQIHVELRIHERPLVVEASKAGLEQVLLNLLLNARDALAEVPSSEAKITVQVGVVQGEISGTPNAESPARFALIRVEDNGAGMGEATRQRVFEPFFTTKAVGRGTGLGLATSYTIVQEHEGDISCESQLGRGAAFTIRLPLAEGPEFVARPRNEDLEPTISGRILIIDDEAGVRRMAERVLSLGLAEVRGSGDGQDALDIVRSGFRADLVLLDRSMPGLSGDEILSSLRAALPEARIVYFTGQEVRPDELEWVDGVIAKPVSAAQLSTQVGHWLSKSREP